MTRRAPRDEPRLPRGVSAVDPPRAGRAFRAAIRHGKAGEVHLGLYPTAAQAAFAYNVAAMAIGRASTPPNPIDLREQPPADLVRRITARARLRLGLDRPPPPKDARPPEVDRLVTLFEVAVVGFWRSEVASSDGPPDDALDRAAARLVEAAETIFWAPSGLGHPEPAAAMAEILARRLDREFRRGEVARALLDDFEDEPDALARWLAHPDAFPGGRARGFRAEVERLYPDFAGLGRSGRSEDWAAVLGVAPPFSFEQVRRAYLARSMESHPDRGGRPEAFVRLQAAYEAARRHCEAHDL